MRKSIVPWTRGFTCADPEGVQGILTPPTPHSKNHKVIGFLSNTGPVPLNRNKATKPSFNV